jgi:glutaredoxin-like protein
MPLLTEEQRAQIKQHLDQHLIDPVDIVHFTQAESPLVVPGRHECQYCKETRELLQEFSDLSDKVRLTVYDLVRDREQAERYGIDSVPATIFSSQHSRGVIRYFGVPSGYEFAAVLEDLVDLSRPESSLSADTLAKLAGLTTDVHIRVFVTPT